jgi:hypothetical protein
MLLFFFLLVADNQPVHYAEKNAVIFKKEGVF